ncbi:MAG TPA: LPS export ABC transporter permease LptF [Methylibium sp.]|nr:LPS export ABC transporter permease LptF [Methylibium sp.]
MMLFDSTLRRDLGRSLAATLIVVLTIVITMFLIRTLGQAAGGAIAPQDVVLLLGYISLEHLPTIISLSLFVAVVGTLTRMYRDSEMVIWFASGVGLLRFVRPVLRLAGPVLVLVAVLALFVWPWGNRQIEELKFRYEQRSDIARVAPGQFQSSSDGRRVFFIDRNTSESQLAHNVFVLERRDGGESVTSARSGRIEMDQGQRYAVLERGQRNDLDFASGEKRIARFDSYRILAGEAPRSVLDDLPPKARSTWALMTQPTSRHLGELTWRIGLAIGGINLVLLGIGLAAGNPRRGGSWNLLLALLTFVVYYNLLTLTQAWVASGKLAMLPTLLVVHGGTFALAVALLWWRERGVSLAGRQRAPARAATAGA